MQWLILTKQAIATIFDKVVSLAASSGYFDAVNAHEPKSAPGNGVPAAVWVQSIKPVTTSGMTSTSGVLLLNVRVYTNFISQPYDVIDPNVLARCGPHRRVLRRF